VRYQAQCVSAMRIAELLAARPSRRARALSWQTDASSIRRSAKCADEGVRHDRHLRLQGRSLAAGGISFAASLKLFALTASLGSTESLVVSPQMMARARSHARNSCACRTSPRVRLRLSIGLEDNR